MAEAFLSLNARDQKDILETIALRSGRAAVILEKDTWICWALRTHFSIRGSRRTRPDAPRAHATRALHASPSHRPYRTTLRRRQLPPIDRAKPTSCAVLPFSSNVAVSLSPPKPSTVLLPS